MKKNCKNWLKYILLNIVSEELRIFVRLRFLVREIKLN